MKESYRVKASVMYSFNCIYIVTNETLAITYITKQHEDYWNFVVENYCIPGKRDRFTERW